MLNREEDTLVSRTIDYPLSPMNKTRFFASLAASVLLLVSFTSCYYDSHYYD